MVDYHVMDVAHGFGIHPRHEADARHYYRAEPLNKADPWLGQRLLHAPRLGWFYDEVAYGSLFL
jgi:hypothetical protein